MYNKTIHSKIELLGQVISDLKSCEADIEVTTDPALRSEYEEERLLIAEELDEVGNRCIKIIEAYIEDCKDNDIPVYLDYVRVLKALKGSVIN